MKLRAVFLWLAGVPSCLLATTDTGEAASAFDKIDADGGVVDDTQYDVVELYNNGKRTRRRVFRPNSSHVIVHETVSSAPPAPSLLPVSLDAVSVPTSGPEGQGTTTEELEEVNASKAARELADTKGIDIRTVTGTGVDGQITKSDVAKHQV